MKKYVFKIQKCHFLIILKNLDGKTDEAANIYIGTAMGIFSIPLQPIFK